MYLKHSWTTRVKELWSCVIPPETPLHCFAFCRAAYMMYSDMTHKITVSLCLFYPSKSQ